MSSMTKSELAQAAGVSRKTLMRWLKKPQMQQVLAAYHLTPKQHKLPGKLIKILCEQYVIDID